MDINEKQANDFMIIPAPANSCSGCWFAGKLFDKLPLCWALTADPLVKQVFKENNGSCNGVIAVLKNEVNNKRIA